VAKDEGWIQNTLLLGDPTLKGIGHEMSKRAYTEWGAPNAVVVFTYAYGDLLLSMIRDGDRDFNCETALELLDRLKDGVVAQRDSDTKKERLAAPTVVM
jgi:hypothetical protein